VPGVTVVRDGGDPEEGREGLPGQGGQEISRMRAGGGPGGGGDLWDTREEDWRGVADVTDSAPGTPSGAPPGPREPVADAAWLSPEDRPWTPIPRPARPLDAGLIPAQRRLKKTSRSA
jgi:hypothetical protein